jgi:hypothetical protein
MIARSAAALTAPVLDAALRVASLRIRRLTFGSCLRFTLAFLLLACDADEEGDDAFECRDGVDNDGDGLSDCDDSDCAASPDCAEVEGDDDDAVEEVLEPDPLRIYEDVVFLASDDLDGRRAGSPGNLTATEYVADLFETLGLAPGGDDGDWFRRFEFARWEPTEEPSLTVAESVVTFPTTDGETLAADWLPDAPGAWSFVKRGDQRGTRMFAGGDLEAATVMDIAAWAAEAQ